MTVLTTAMLEERGAKGDTLAKFTKMWPNGMPLTRDNLAGAGTLGFRHSFFVRDMPGATEHDDYWHKVFNRYYPTVSRFPDTVEVMVEGTIYEGISKSDQVLMKQMRADWERRAISVVLDTWGAGDELADSHRNDVERDNGVRKSHEAERETRKEVHSCQ